MYDYIMYYVHVCVCSSLFLDNIREWVDSLCVCGRPHHVIHFCPFWFKNVIYYHCTRDSALLLSFYKLASLHEMIFILVPPICAILHDQNVIREPWLHHHNFHIVGSVGAHDVREPSCFSQFLHSSLKEMPLLATMFVLKAWSFFLRMLMRPL